MNKFLKFVKTPRFRLAIGSGLLAIGLIVFGLFWLMTSNHEHSATKPQPVSKVLKDTKPVTNSQPQVSGVPVHISIPSVGIDLSVIPGYYNKSNGSWTLSLNDAQWGTMTAKPNNKEGDTFIYAHYRLHVFYTLPKVRPGDQAIVTTDSGHTFTYTFTSSTITSPSDTRLFTYQGKPILILQTCTGAWYQYRQLFVFDLSKYS